MKPGEQQLVELDLNNPVFQRQLFSLPKDEQLNVLRTLRKLSGMTWQQVYQDVGLKWELVHSRKGPHGERLVFDWEGCFGVWPAAKVHGCVSYLSIRIIIQLTIDFEAGRRFQSS